MSENLHPVGRFVARNRRGFMARKVAGLCRRYMKWYGNLDYDLRTNGEGFVLERLGSLGPRVLFDVGANVGDWTVAAAALCPGATIHAFEISEPTFKVLVERTRGLPKVVCRNVGLSDAAGRVTLRHYPELPALTTSSAYPHPFPFTEVSGEVMTGDECAEGAGIDRIDLLKIDVEGMEDRVIKGFERMLSRQAIDVVQFEYGRVNIVNRYLLADFHAFFRERGYVVGKVYPNYVDFREYELDDEDFLGPNYLACPERSTELRRMFGMEKRHKT